MTVKDEIMLQQETSHHKPCASLFSIVLSEKVLPLHGLHSDSSAQMNCVKPSGNCVADVQIIGFEAT